GWLSDHAGRRPVVAAGYSVFAVVYLGFAWFNSAEAAWLLFIFYGLYYTLTQGVQRALAADYARPESRAAEIGAFHMVVGLGVLPASLIGGWLYTLAPQAPFYLGGCTAALAAFLLMALQRDGAVAL